MRLLLSSGRAKRVRAKELPTLLTAIAGNGLGVPFGLEVALLDEELAGSTALGVWTNFRLSKHCLLPIFKARFSSFDSLS